MKSYKVREEFSELKEFTLHLPETFDRNGFVIQGNRNIVKKITTAQGTFVIKNFKGMYFFNRLAYSIFRKSKAERSYIYSGILNEKGISTPPHVSWIDCYKLGLLTNSYFVSVYYPYQTIKQVLDYLNIYDDTLKLSLLHHLAVFSKKLHSLGIYHDDFSVGNILVKKKLQDYEFALVDLNRIKFHKVSYIKGLRSFTKLNIDPEDMNILIGEYARLSNELPKSSIDLFWLYKKRSSFLRRLRKKIRHYTLKPLERLLHPKHPRVI